MEEQFYYIKDWKPIFMESYEPIMDEIKEQKNIDSYLAKKDTKLYKAIDVLNNKIPTLEFSVENTGKFTYNIPIKDTVVIKVKFKREPTPLILKEIVQYILVKGTIDVVSVIKTNNSQVNKQTETSFQKIDKKDTKFEKAEKTEKIEKDKSEI